MGVSRHSRPGRRAVRELGGWSEDRAVRGVVPRCFTRSSSRRSRACGEKHAGFRLSANNLRSRNSRSTSRLFGRSRSLDRARTRVVEFEERRRSRRGGKRGVRGVRHDGSKSPLSARTLGEEYCDPRPDHDELAAHPTRHSRRGSRPRARRVRTLCRSAVSCERLNISEVCEGAPSGERPKYSPPPSPPTWTSRPPRIKARSPAWKSKTTSEGRAMFVRPSFRAATISFVP